MGSISYNFSAEAFTSVKSAGGVLERLQSVDGDRELLEQQLFENMTVDNGQFCLINDFSTIDDNGYFNDLSVNFLIYTEETEIAEILEQLTAEQMTIINEIYPYTYEGFDEGNQQITIFANGTNGLTEPIIMVDMESFFDLFNFYKYDITMDINEESALNDKYGYSAGSNTADQINAAVTTISSEVVNSYLSERMILNRVPRTKIEPTQFGDIDPISLDLPLASEAIIDTGVTSETASGVVATNTSRGY